MDKIDNQEYVRIRDNFLKTKAEKEDLIKQYKSKIEESNNQIKNLEKIINSSRPLIEGCDRAVRCKKCDIYSMEYEGQSPGQGEHFNWYKCIICGHSDYYT